MNKAWKYLAGNILGGAVPDEVDIRQMDGLVDEHPWFAGLHYLRAVRLDKTDDAPSARSKAALYFQNPHWLRALLDDTETVSVTESTLSELLSTPSSELVDMDRPLQTEPQFPEEELVMAVEKAEQEFDDKRTDEVHPETQWQHTLAENPVFHQETTSDEETFEHHIWQAREQVSEPTADAPGESDSPEPPVALEREGGEEGSVEMIAAPAEIPAIQEDLQAEAAEPAQPTAEETVIPFEPLYTIDYFASQGIKYNLDSGKDQLSLKMKSFTEWLKSMKRIHPEKVDSVVADDAVIRESAETSNNSQDIYTEAMAEVYLKQGLKEKAREVYQKLSLLDPSKSAYFAVRIKEIKEN
jgi:hypothetical protein